MSMTEIIEDMTHEMVGESDFPYMNKPIPPNGQAYIQRDYKTGDLWVCCPYCSKKNLKIKDNTSISDLELKCKGSNCKKNFFVNLKEGKVIE